MKPSKVLLPVFTCCIIIINLLVMVYLDDSAAHWTRFASMCGYFLLFISPWYFNRRGLPVFILLLISDALLINYEQPVNNALIFIVRTLAFLALTGLVFYRLRQLQTNFFQKIVFISAIALNVFLLYNLVEMVPTSQSYAFSDILFYIYGVSVIICVTAAVSFSNRYAIRASIFFLGSVLSLAFSDLAYFIAVSLEFSEFSLVDIVLNTLGIAFLIKFMFLERLENKDTTSQLDA